MAARNTPNSPPPPTSLRVSRRRLLSGAALGGTLGACASSGRQADEQARLDELFSDLEDQSGEHEPIRSQEREARRKRLGHLLSERGIDAWISEGGPTMGYLSDVSWGHSERLFALVVVADGSHFWVCPAFEEQRARLSIGGTDGPGGPIITWEEHEYAWAPLHAALRERGCRRVAVDPEARGFIAQELAREQQSGDLPGGEVVSGRGVLIALRAIKDAHELALLRAANELTQQALVAVSERLETGMDSAAIGDMMHAAQRRLGLENTWALTLIGPAAAYPHGDKKQRVLERNQFLLIDTGGGLHGYQSDNTRTWIVDGTPGVRELRTWNAVRDAQQRAFETIRPGVPCSAVDRAARSFLEESGFGSGYEHFTHRLGHGIGIQGHEDPYFDAGSEVILTPGMTLSDEPGLYYYGEFGIRIEDIVVVTSSGADHFGQWQTSPTSLA